MTSGLLGSDQESDDVIRERANRVVAQVVEPRGFCFGSLLDGSNFLVPRPRDLRADRLLLRFQPRFELLDAALGLRSSRLDQLSGLLLGFRQHPLELSLGFEEPGELVLRVGDRALATDFFAVRHVQLPASKVPEAGPAVGLLNDHPSA